MVNGFIYIIQSGDDDLYKVGLTQDSPEKRKKELDKTGTPKKLKLIESYEVENIYQIEKEIHNNLKEFKNFECLVQIRHQHDPVHCKIDFNNGFNVIFDQEIRGVANGQSAVFYKDNLCLGGGVIEARNNDL